MNSLEKIKELFKNQKAHIAYLTAGDGDSLATINAALALIKGGVNLLEIGVPFSDPIADGPVIQEAAARALKNGTHLKQVLEIVAAIRKQSEIPIILFSYYNPILSIMSSSFFQEATQAGVDGLLIVDCPLEESQTIKEKCFEHQIALINVITPSTSMDRLALIDSQAQGFLYYACRKGTTGVKSGLPDDFSKNIQVIKSIVHLPVVVGFGISDRTTAEKVLEHADGVVVGSLFVKALTEGCTSEELQSLAQKLYPTTR